MKKLCGICCCESKGAHRKSVRREPPSDRKIKGKPLRLTAFYKPAPLRFLPCLYTFLLGGNYEKDVQKNVIAFSCIADADVGFDRSDLAHAALKPLQIRQLFAAGFESAQTKPFCNRQQTIFERFSFF